MTKFTIKWLDAHGNEVARAEYICMQMQDAVTHASYLMVCTFRPHPMHDAVRMEISR